MDEIKLYENKEIRSVWDEEKEEWYFSVVDVVGVLTEQENARGASTYWAVLKKRLKEEGNELLTICKQLKMKATDGKMRLTDVADMQGIFRIIQSIPSPKAEPFKLWLAEVGKERIDEIIDPELTIDRALETYLKKEPIPLSEKDINLILEKVQKRAAPKPKIFFDNGENVRITEGPFANFTGIVEEYDMIHGKLRLNVSIFGRSTPVEILYSQVEKIV